MEYFDVFIEAESLKKLREIDKYDLDIKRRAAHLDSRNIYVVPGILTNTDIDKLREVGYNVTVVRDLSSVALDRQLQVPKTNRFADLKTDTLEASLTVQGYLTNEEIDSAIAILTNTNSDISTRIELPFLTWEADVHMLYGCALAQSPFVRVYYSLEACMPENGEAPTSAWHF